MSVSVFLENPTDYETTSNSWQNVFSYSIPVDTTVLVVGDILARSGSDVFTTRIRAALRRDGTNDLASLLANAYELLDSYKSLGALLWDFRVRLDGDAYIYIDLKGKASATTRWVLDIDVIGSDT